MKAVNLWKTLFCAALAITTFGACSDDDKDDEGGLPSITVNGEASATVAVKLDGGTTDAIEVVSTGSWALTFDDETASSWCHPSRETGGKGKTTLTFTVDPWEGAASNAERQVTAKLLTNGSFEGIPIPKTATITVKQNGAGSTEVTTNVKEIRALLKAMNLTESSMDVTTEIAAMTLTGIVVSDGEGNNMSNQYQIAVQDSGTEANSGLMINATMFNTTKVTPGQVLTATLTKAKAQLKNGAIQLGLNDDEVQLTAGTAPAPIVITPDKIGDYEGQFVRIENCQPELDFVGKAWNTGSSKDGGNGGNVNFELLEGTGTFIVFCGSYATSFCKNIVPEKSGYIQGISTQYKGTLEIAPRMVADFDGLTGDYKGPEYKTGTISQIKAGEYWEITASIVATYTRGFLIADNSGYTLVYNAAWTSQTDNTYTVGQKVTVKGKIAQFPEGVGLLQFEAPTITADGTEQFDPGQPVEFNAAALTAYESDMSYKYVTLSGVLKIEEKESTTSGKYYSYTVAVAGYDSKVVTIAYAFDKDFADLATGDVVDVTGFAIGTNFDKSAINIMQKTIVKNTAAPNITTPTPSVTFAGAGEEKEISYNAVNITAGNNIYAKLSGANADQFEITSNPADGKLKVTAKVNSSSDEYTASLMIYAATSAEDANPEASTIITLTQSAGKARTILAGWVFANKDNMKATSGNTAAELSRVGVATAISYTASSKTIYCSGWDGADATEKYWLLTIPFTTAIPANSTLSIDWQAYGTNTAPKNWDIEYSTDNANWTKIGSVAYTSAIKDYDLSQALASGIPAGTIYIRFKVNGTVSINDGTVASGGNSRLANIEVYY